MRDKWDSRRGEETYGEMTMKKAVAGCDSFYTPKTSAAEDFLPGDEPGKSQEGIAANLSPADELDMLLAGNLTREDMLSPAFLKLAWWAKQEDTPRYLQILDKLPRKMTTRIFETELKKWCMSKLPGEIKEGRLLKLTGCNTGSLIAAPGWIVNDDGIFYLEVTKNCDVQEVQVCAEPVFISGKMVDMDDHSEKLELTYLRNGSYRTKIVPRSQVMDKNQVLKLADFGLPFSSENQAKVTKYFAENETANRHVIPIRRCISRAGWFGAEFFPYGMLAEAATNDDGKGTTNLVEALHTHGREENWLSPAALVRAYPFARCLLAASFAAPLLSRLEHRNIFMHVWYESRGGKTALLKLALSVWGNPEILMGSYNATRYGLEQRANTLKHLPVGLDELQSLQEKRMTAEELVYILSNGEGKTQGKIGSGIRKPGRWNTCILSTGEQPISKSNTMDGVNTRLLELNAVFCKPFL